MVWGNYILDPLCQRRRPNSGRLAKFSRRCWRQSDVGHTAGQPSSISLYFLALFYYLFIRAYILFVFGTSCRERAEIWTNSYIPQRIFASSCNDTLRESSQPVTNCRMSLFLVLCSRNWLPLMNRKGEKPQASSKPLVKKPSEKNIRVSHSLAAAHLRAFIYNI